MNLIGHSDDGPAACHKTALEAFQKQQPIIISMQHAH